MRNLLIGCTALALVALTPKTEARPPALLQSQLPVPVIKAMEPTIGISSWYGEECLGNATASGELFDMNGLSAAHRDLPFGTKIRVTNLNNHKSLVVRVNDRGPSIPGRVLDVSKASAARLGFLRAGLTTVQVEVLSYPKQGPSEPTKQ